MWNNQKQQKCFSLCQIYKPKISLNQISQNGPTYRGQVVNLRHQTPQGESVAKPGTPLLDILVGNVKMA